MENSFRVKLTDGSMMPFSRDKLLLSIYDALKHRPKAIDEAGALTNTVIAELISEHSLLVQRNKLVDTTYKILTKFSRSSALIYSAQHPKHII